MKQILPWYRHRWPWFLMAGPFIVVVAGFVTLWLAIKTDDGLITEDYYQKGLAINQTLQLNDTARRMGLMARMIINTEQLDLRLSAQADNFVPPPRLRLTLSHPTRAGMDQQQIVDFHDGRYKAHFQLPQNGHWILTLADVDGYWSMTGNVVLPANDEILLGVLEQTTLSN